MLLAISYTYYYKKWNKTTDLNQRDQTRYGLCPADQVGGAGVEFGNWEWQLLGYLKVNNKRHHTRALYPHRQ